MLLCCSPPLFFFILFFIFFNFYFSKIFRDGTFNNKTTKLLKVLIYNGFRNFRVNNKRTTENNREQQGTTPPIKVNGLILIVPP